MMWVDFENVGPKPLASVGVRLKKVILVGTFTSNKSPYEECKPKDRHDNCLGHE